MDTLSVGERAISNGLHPMIPCRPGPLPDFFYFRCEIFKAQKSNFIGRSLLLKKINPASFIRSREMQNACSMSHHSNRRMLTVWTTFATSTIVPTCNKIRVEYYGRLPNERTLPEQLTGRLSRRIAEAGLFVWSKN